MKVHRKSCGCDDNTCCTCAPKKSHGKCGSRHCNVRKSPYFVEICRPASDVHPGYVGNTGHSPKMGAHGDGDGDNSACDTRDCGLQIHVVDSGPKKGPVVVFLRCVGFAAPEQFQYQHEALSAQGFRVLTIDLPGIGESDKPYIDYDLDIWADYLRDILDELDLCNITLVGVSAFRSIVARYASRHKCHRLCRIVFMSITTSGANPPSPFGLPPAVLDQFTEQARAGGVQALFAQFIPGFYAPEAIPQPTYDWLFQGAVTTPVRTMIAFFQEILKSDITQDLRRLCVPTLVIQGENDVLNPLPATLAALPLIPDGQLITFPTGHAVFLIDPIGFSNAIADFARDCKPSKSRKDCVKRCER